MQFLDEVVTAGLTSAPLTANQSRLVYNGGNSVKIAKLSTDGYSDYSRSSGYTEGAATLAWEDHTIPHGSRQVFQRRCYGRRRNDEDPLSATTSSASLRRTRKFPRLTPTAYSSIFAAIVDDATVRYGYYSSSRYAPYSRFQGNVADIQDAIGEQEPLIAFMSMTAWKYLTTSTELSKQLMVAMAGKASTPRPTRSTEYASSLFPLPA